MCATTSFVFFFFFFGYSKIIGLESHPDVVASFFELINQSVQFIPGIANEMTFNLAILSLSLTGTITLGMHMHDLTPFLILRARNDGGNIDILDQTGCTTSRN